MTSPPATDRVLTIGVDSHKDAHVAAAVDQLGRILATTSIPTHPRASSSWSAGPGGWVRSIGSGLRAPAASRPG
jgi:transposase